MKDKIPGINLGNTDAPSMPSESEMEDVIDEHTNEDGDWINDSHKKQAARSIVSAFDRAEDAGRQLEKQKQESDNKLYKMAALGMLTSMATLLTVVGYAYGVFP